MDTSLGVQTVEELVSHVETAPELVGGAMHLVSMRASVKHPTSVTSFGISTNRTTLQNSQSSLETNYQLSVMLSICSKFPRMGALLLRRFYEVFYRVKRLLTRD